MRNTRWVLIRVALVGAALSMMGRGNGAGSTLVVQAADGWETHRYPAGYSLQLPPGWTVKTDRKSGRAQLQGPRREEAIIWPVFLAGHLGVRSAAAVLKRLVQSTGVGGEWGEAQPAGPRAVRMVGRMGDRVSVGVLAWLAGTRGNAAYLYLAVAPESTYRQVQKTFARILSSFRISGTPSGKPAVQALKYARWQDPIEGAFSLEAPEGWDIQGGLHRFAPVDTRGAWELVSPDGAIRITGGDAGLPPFTEPNPMLAFAGFVEGSWYSPGYGVRMFVRRYVPGAVFAREYAATRATEGCDNLTFTENRPRPDAVAGINAIYTRYGGMGLGINLTAGEAAFTCRRAGRSMAGYYFAGTQRVQAAGMPGGLWNVEYLFGYLAPEERQALAESILQHVLASIRLNPQWVAMQQNVAANTSQIVSRTHAEISRMITHSYEGRQAVMHELGRRRSNAILEVEDVVDPVTGQELKVESGSNYYWIDQRGTLVGTQTDSQPNIDFRRLIRLP